MEQTSKQTNSYFGHTKISRLQPKNPLASFINKIDFCAPSLCLCPDALYFAMALWRRHWFTGFR